MPHRHTTQPSLLARVSGNDDPRAWQEFCARYGELIRGFATRRGLQGADADDVAQDVLVALTKSMPGFTYDPAKGKFRAYLKTMVVRAVYRKNFQNRADIRLEDIDAAAANTDRNADEIWEEEWRQYHIRLAMRTITREFNEHDRDAFQRYAVAGRAATETAEELGLSVEQVYKAKSRILKRLSALIEQQTAEEG